MLKFFGGEVYCPFKTSTTTQKCGVSKIFFLIIYYFY